MVSLKTSLHKLKRKTKIRINTYTIKILFHLFLYKFIISTDQVILFV